MLLDVKVIIETHSTIRGGSERITLGSDDFIKLRETLNKLTDGKESPSKNSGHNVTNLESVEQGLLIKELCKRSGVYSFIAKKGSRYAVAANDLFKDGNGPANIIIVTNDESGGI